MKPLADLLYVHAVNTVIRDCVTAYLKDLVFFDVLYKM